MGTKEVLLKNYLKILVFMNSCLRGKGEKGGGVGGGGGDKEFT